MEEDDTKDNDSVSSLSDMSETELEKLSPERDQSEKDHPEPHHSEKHTNSTSPGKYPQPPNYNMPSLTIRKLPTPSILHPTTPSNGSGAPLGG